MLAPPDAVGPAGPGAPLVPFVPLVPSMPFLPSLPAGPCGPCAPPSASARLASRLAALAVRSAFLAVFTELALAVTWAPPKAGPARLTASATATSATSGRVIFVRMVCDASLVGDRDVVGHCP